MKIKLLILSIAVLCLNAAPARADMVLFDFHYGSLTSTYTPSNPLDLLAGGGFSASEIPTLTVGSVTRQQAPTGVTVFSPPWAGPENFSLSMNITNIDNVLLTADAIGEFTLTDTDADTITGDIKGHWGRWPGANTFAGKLSNVLFNDLGAKDGNFDGHFGFVSMSFTAPQPWSGTLIELSSTGTWFGYGDYTTNSGSVDATVVPVPAAVILGILGLGVAGLKLRKYA